MSEKPILYSFWRSSCAWRVRIALNLKGVEYEYRALDVVSGRQHDEAFRKLNPNAKIPTFIHGGHSITQSLAIIEYLDETFSDKTPLISGSPIQKALIRDLTLLIIADIQPLQNIVFRTLDGEVDDDKTRDWAAYYITKGFNALEKRLQQTAGKYSIGDTLTLVDLCVPPQIFNAHRNKVDMSKYPTLTRINDNLAQLNAFKRAHARVQPDTPHDEAQ